MGLTKQDLDVLIDAVEAWERKEKNEGHLSDLVEAMLCRSKEEQEALQRDQAVRKLKQADASKIKKERSIVLRAKLLSIRDTLVAGQVFDNAVRTEPEVASVQP